ncbi:MAG: hypothetical protein F7C38_05895 [Desulfurococcales archaeon]|nr:hypothetical protein [Desulfurococcales archaeon]
MVRKADLVTLSSASTTTLALGLAVEGHITLAIRLLFLSYTLDVVDGIVARYEGPTREGFLLDRAVDRYSQVVAPSLLLLSLTGASPPYIAYAMLLVPLGFYRLVYRQVHGREYFSGLPFIAHALYILFTIVSGGTPHPIPLLLLLAATAAPIPYYRRPLRGRATDSTFKYRQLLYDVARISFMTLFIITPYNWLVRALAQLLAYTILLYTLTGYIPVIVAKKHTITTRKQSHKTNNMNINNINDLVATEPRGNR